MKIFRKVIQWLKYNLSHEWCYDRMIDNDQIVAGHCYGQVGGDRESGYLCYMCMDCPHWIPYKEDAE